MTSLKVLILNIAWVFSLKQALTQEVQFTLYGLNPCTGKVENIIFYSLKKEGIYFPKDSTGTCILMDTGIYTLTFFEEEKYYVFEEFKAYSDTLRLPTIRFCLEPTTYIAFSGYCCCDTLCDGNQSDYYSNGNKRIEGFFNKGKPCGKISFYYPSGQLRLVEEYNKRGKLLRKFQYDTKGNLIKTK